MALMTSYYAYGLIGTLALCFILFCIGRHMHSRSSTRKSPSRPASAMVIFGSGGHTTEMLHMIRDVTPAQLSPLMFVTAHSDHTSAEKIHSFGLQCISHVKWASIHRSREVKQSWASTVFSTALALLQSFLLVLRFQPQVILCNGPGTCVPICLAAVILRFFSAQWYSPRIVFAESYCRVRTLSVTGRILYPLADRFVVQWPGLLRDRPRATYIGKIC